VPKQAILFATKSNPQEYREQGAESLVNAYYETMDDGKFRIRMTPGLAVWSAGPDDANARGALVVDGVLYAVYETGTYSVDSTGARTFIGYVSGTGPVQMERNSAEVPQIGILTDTGRYYVIQGGVMAIQNIGDLPTFISLTRLGPYFVFGVADGRFFNSGLNDATAINGLDFATAEAEPDGLKRVIRHRGELWLGGDTTTEVWGLSSSPPATGSPFIKNGAVGDKGTIAGLSFARADNTLFWVGNDRIVYRNDNYSPVRISNFAVERAIEKAANPELIIGSVYVKNGHTFYQISAAEWTYTFDIAENKWHQRRSLNSPRSRVVFYIEAFGKTLALTRDDGNIYEVDMEAHDENGQELITECISVPMGEPGERYIVNSIELDFVTGRALISGTTPQTNPVVELSYSDNGGASFSSPRQLSLGQIGEYNHRVKTHRLGMTSNKWGRVWKLGISDPHVRSFSRMIADVDRIET
jgi:hypothetical protein